MVKLKIVWYGDGEERSLVLYKILVQEIYKMVPEHLERFEDKNVQIEYLGDNKKKRFEIGILSIDESGEKITISSTTTVKDIAIKDIQKLFLKEEGLPASEKEEDEFAEWGRKQSARKVVFKKDINDKGEEVVVGFKTLD